jgi:hypothetical protein
MAKVNYPRTSPYANTPQTSWYLGSYVNRRILRDSRDTLFTLEPHHNFRPDVLSNEIYGTPALWWVFMVRNINIMRDPVNDFTTGKTIYVPAYSYLKTVLGI